jgi:hypothetical protein
MPKDKRLIVIGLLALIALVGIPDDTDATTPGTRVRIEPADLVASSNETFVVQVVIEEANDLGAFQFNLVYDPSVLQVTEAALGDFLESTGNSAVIMGPEINNAEGRATLGAISFGSAAGPSGEGVLAIITCIAQEEGSTALALREVQVLGTAASVQGATVEDGQVVVRSAEAPTPTVTATLIPAATATPTPPPTATPAPAATATPAPAATATPMPTNTPEAMDTLTPAATALPSPTPLATSPAAETPTETPPPSPTPSPMPSVSVAPTETKPTEAITPTAVPTVEATQTPTAETITPTSPPATLPPPFPSPTPMPSPTPIPSPTPLATAPAPAATGPSSGVALGLMLAALAVAILAVFILSRRPI